jgi:hypothetical protein
MARPALQLLVKRQIDKEQEDIDKEQDDMFV